MDYKYKISIEYVEEGLNYTVNNSINIYGNMLSSSLTRFEDIKELFTIEKKAISLVKKGVRDLNIEIQVTEVQGYTETKALNLIRYCKKFDNAYRRLFLEDAHNTNLTESHEEITDKEVLKLLKSDFETCKKDMKQLALNLINEKLKEN